MRKSLVSSFAGPLLIAVAVGCGDSDEKRAAVGYSMLTSNNPFFKVIEATMHEEAAKRGYELLAVSAEEKVHTQASQIEDFITRGVKAIVLNPVDSRAIGAAIRRANTAGIPVFTNDIACLDPTAEVVTHVATDNEAGGHLAAQALIEALGGKGKVAILDYPKVESVMLRTKGFRAEVEAQNQREDVEIAIVADLDGGGDRAKSRAAAQDLVQAHPDLRGIFAINDPSALGAISALEEAGKLGDVVVVGFDGAPEGKRAVLEGKEYATPVQFPRQIGATTIDLIARYYEGEKPAKEVLIPPRIYKKADAEKDPNLGGW
jgi:ribose transport system substrate-binding protein